MALSDRQNQLAGLAAQMPVANQEVAQGLQTAAELQRRSSMSQASPYATKAQAQQAGAAATAAKQNANIQAGAQTQEQAMQLAQAGLQNTQADNEQKIASRRNALTAQQQELQNRLASMSGEVKQQLFDKQMDFVKDELGRTTFTQQQLADWATTKAKTYEDYQNYVQSMEQASERRNQILKASYARITQALQQGFISEQEPLDQAMRANLTKARQELQLKIQRQQAEQRSTMAMYQAGGTILGAAVAGVAVVATGGMAAPVAAGIVGMGAAAGGGLGSIAGSTNYGGI